MKKIDIHTHIIPEKMPNWFQKFGYGDFIHLEHHKPCCAKMIKGEQVFREIEHNCWSPTERLSDMEKTEVSMQILSTIPALFNYWAKPQHALETSRFLNDHIASTVANHDKHFLGLGTLPMQDIDLAIKEMGRCKDELSLSGIELGTHINQVNLSDKRFDAFWQAAQDLDMSIFIHPWEMMGEDDMKKYWLPWLVGMPAETSRAICSIIFSGVLERFPRLRFAFAHGGGAFPATLGRVQHGFDVRPDLCAIDNDVNPRDYIGRFWIDSLVHDGDALEFVIKILGEDKVCLGSDYPFPLGEHHPGQLIESCIHNEGIKRKILWNNAMEWLGRL